MLAGCASRYACFLSASGTQKTVMQELFGLLERYTSPADAEARFVVNTQIIDIFTDAELDQKKIQFLLSVTAAFPDDPYNAYYLTIVAQTYHQSGADIFAKYYYERVVKNYPDLLFRNEYLHKYCLEQIALIATKPEDRRFAYQELLNRFYNSDPEKQANALFHLARSYEATSEWTAAMNTYRDFIALPKVVIPGYPNAHERAVEKLSMYEAPPEWVVHDLHVLVSRIKTAIAEKDVETLNKYRAKGYFFSISWEQKRTDEKAFYAAQNVAEYLGNFLVRSDVHTADTLDIDSSASEAYLRTENWQFKIHSTWYFYFRKVEFGPDPDINGGWEWTGIYFGEKL